jgi:CDP-diacylglycerol--serine O-phosphatidyltransferase
MRRLVFKPFRERAVKLPVLPTLLTLGNAVCGLASISYAASSVPESTTDSGLFIAGLLIFAAMIFDMLDGSVARWTKQATKFGGELDSLCDAVSFGVAPAFIILQMADAYHPRILWAIAALFMTCTILRLARYNVESDSNDHHDAFSGLPSPAAAATIAAFAVVAPNASSLMVPDAALSLLPSETWTLSVVRNAVPIIGLVLAGLMVSRIRYPHLAKQALRGKRQFRQLAQIVFAIAAIVALGELAAPLILCTFVAAAPLRAAWQFFADPPADKPPPTAEPGPSHAADSASGDSRHPLAGKLPGLRLRWRNRDGRKRKGA